MNQLTYFRTLLFVLCLFVLSGLACKQGGNPPASQSANSQSAAAPAATSSAVSTSDISGSYAVAGTNESGGGKYAGTLAVKSRGDVYQFSWQSGSRRYDGVGVKTDDHVAVAFTEGTNGKGCGVVLYKISGDGKLDGKAGYWGTDTSETEVATRTNGAGLDGEYSVKGTNAGGGNYTGTLKVAQEGTGYKFDWAAGSPMSGFGVRQGDKVAAGFGGSQCGFVSYAIKPDGSLDGKWGAATSRSLGTETAVRQ